MHNPSDFVSTGQPVMIDGNAYAGHAYPFRAEENFIMTRGMTADVTEDGGRWILSLSVPAEVANASCLPVSTERLGTPRVTEEPYETPDGKPIDFAEDFLGNRRTDTVIPGPFAALTAGEQKIEVWHR